MPRLVHAAPKYRLHRPSGQAVVTIQGKDHYLGRHGSKSSKAEYDRLIAEWLAKGRLDHEPPPASDLTVTELIAAYWRFAERHYVKRGRPTSEQDCIRSALRHLRRLYGHMPATKFGPIALKAVRQAMIDANLCRSTINKHVGRIRQVFRWAAAEELLPATIHHALAALPGLQRGRCTAREPEPIGPVMDSVVDRTIPYLRPVVADMVRLQRLTGCRPEEVCMIRPCDVDTDDDVWSYRPESHKTEHRNRERVIFIGPKGQDILRPYLLREKTSYCFCPAESERKRRAQASEQRVTPLHYGNSPGANRSRRPKRPAGKQYTTGSYRKAIHRACELAFKMPGELRRPADDETPEQETDRLKLARKWRDENTWHPNQLRHSAATEIRKRFGLEAAQVTLGHAGANVTQVYAERDLAKAAMVVREVG